jgi:hypothetical protein
MRIGTVERAFCFFHNEACMSLYYRIDTCTHFAGFVVQEYYSYGESEIIFIFNMHPTCMDVHSMLNDECMIVIQWTPKVLPEPFSSFYLLHNERCVNAWHMIM